MFESIVGRSVGFAVYVIFPVCVVNGVFTDLVGHGLTPFAAFALAYTLGSSAKWRWSKAGFHDPD